MSRMTQSLPWAKRLAVLVALCLALSLLVALLSTARAAGPLAPLDGGSAEQAEPLTPVQGPPPRLSAISSGPARARQILAPPPTAEPTDVPTPEATPVLTLTLAITPTTALAGDGVVLRVSAANLGPDAAAGVVFSMTLPSAVEYQGPVGDVPRLAYDPEHGTLTWQVGNVPAGVGGSFACTLRVAEGAEPGEHVFAAVLSADPPAQGAAAQARLWVEPAGDAPVRLTPEEGGFLASGDGRVEVFVPSGAVTETLLLSYQAVPTSTPELLFSFVLTATSEAGGWAVPALGRPMTLTLSLPAGVGPDVEPVHWDEAQGSWEVVPYHVLSPTLQITAITKELGTFGLLSGGTEQDGTQYLLGPSVRGIQADEFTGGASFSYPIDVPALPGGLALSLGLSYSSEEADGMLTFNGPYEHSSQASWAGLGWSVSGLGRIYRSDTRYFLSFAGGSYELVQDETYTWQTIPHSFLRVEHANNGIFHWDVWTQDGTKYVFGNPTDVWGNGTAYTRWESCGMPDDKRGYAWHLTKVVDTHGNKLQIDYAHEVGVFHNVCTRDYMRATRPSLLSVYPAGAAAPTVQVLFTPAAEKRADWRLSLGDAYTKPWTDTTCQEGAETYGYFFYSCYRLSSVDVQVKQSAGWVSVGRYDLAHETIGNDDPAWQGRYYHIVLRSIQAHGTATAPGMLGPEFPTRYEFGYSYAGSEDYEINRSRLTTASNGHGGEVSLAWQYFTTTTPWPECEPVVTYKRYRVASRVVDGGVSGPITTTYAYSGADAGCPTGEQGSPDFFGHAQVEATSKDDGGATLQRSRTTFLQADPVLRGKADLTQVLDAGGLELQATDQAWSSAGGWAQLDVVTTTLHEGGASQASKTVYHYDTFWQNYCTGGTGPQYGHATRVEVYAAADDPAPARTTLSGFCPNTTAWIVDKPAFTNLYTGAIAAPPNIPGTGTLQSSTWFIYDNNQDNPDPAWNRAAGSKGELRAVRRTYDWTGSYLLADTRYWHDAYGNVTKEQTYTGYGSSTAWASANPRTTETTYDGTFHTFAVSVDPPLLPATTPQYYGVNGPGLDTTGAYFGWVSSVTDPNNVTVEQVRYDSFGRQAKELRPGDSDWSLPTVETTYTDDYAYGGFQGVKVQQNLREQSGVSGAVQVNFSFYDGLGQLVETLTERTNGAEQVLAYTAYDGLGRVKDAYAPYVVNSDFWNFKPVDAGKPRTTTTYDALGRTVRVTAPDGAYTEHHYGIVDGLTYDDVLDANRHRKQYRYDSFGQLRRVDEIDGNCGNYWGYACSAPHTDEWTVYATTEYEYDANGNLLTLTDAAGNESTMTYDNLGRKATMVDPDMGSWDYGYDASGNLSRQDDAKHQRTCFYYDTLNRLTSKYYTNDQTDCPSSPTCPVSYGYDVGTNGKGRRTSMTDGSGSTSWSYDQRGRTTQESKAITGAPGSPFVTSYSYDAMDRVVTMTYPDEEVVQNSYNAAAQLAEVRSTTHSLNYATGLAYDALGQLTQMTYGNNVQTRLGYWGTGGAWDSRPGSGLVNFGRLYRLRATTGSGGAPLIDLRYNYDLAGNVTQIKEPPAAASGWPTSGFSFQDDFTSKNTTNWWWSAYQVVPDAPNNWVKSVGTGSNYDAHFYRTSYSLSSGQGLQVRLKVSQTDANAHVSIEANDATYRRFGVIAGSGKLYVQYNDGSGYRYPADLLTGLQTNTWYVVRVVVDDVRGFYVEAYQESNPTVRGSYNTPMPAGKQWRFHHWNYRGTAYLDTYREFSTAGMTWSPDERMTFGYDALDRLTSAAPESGAQGYNETYQYYPIGNLKNKSGVEYTYPASGQGSVRPHAVGSTTGGGSFGYDSNGNMTSRRLQTGGTTYTQGWDQENWLISVTGGTQASAMAYDGDGNLVKKTVGSTTTVYIGAYFERTGDVTTSYYYAGGTRVAKRSGGVVTYLHGDHLGSASLATSSSGVVVANSSTRYYPYGTTRSGGTGLPTDYRFTGQLLDASSGLYHMGARWYDGSLARWLSADTIVPTLANPQSLNRYSWVLGNPLNSTDPSGHTVRSALDLVRRYREDIKCMAAKYRIPALLLAGVVFAENRNDYNFVPDQDWSSVFSLGIAGGPEIKNFLGSLFKKNVSTGITEVSVAVAAMIDHPELVPADYGDMSWEERTKLHTEIANNLPSDERKRILDALGDPKTALEYAAQYLSFLASYRDYGDDYALWLSDYNRGLSNWGSTTPYGQRIETYGENIGYVLNWQEPDWPICIGSIGCAKLFDEMLYGSLP